MLHKHSSCSLLGCHRQAVYYPPDGTGRDSYIRLDNGGTNIAHRHQGVPQSGNFMKFGCLNRGFRPVAYARFRKYASDGTGRDKYVTIGHGGQYNQEEENRALLVKFKETMRDGGWKKEARNSASDFSSPSQIKAERELSKTQVVLNQRLSIPNKKSQKYSKKLQLIRKKYIKF